MRFRFTSPGIALTLTVALTHSSPVHADSALPEYEVKAAIVYKVSKFVDWPPGSFESDDAPIVLCIAGRDPFGKFIDNLSGQIVHGRSLVIHRVADSELSFRRCHILFIGADSSGIEILANAGSQAVLTIGDSKGFAAHGGMLELRIENNRVKFQVNLEVARDSDLDISASLLQLATIVESPGG
ncbi:MAG: YfiR family protein [Woeseiaceae bacterium]